ncbi:MAG TPA: dihydrolipoamide acetyltransferase family protein [Anaerolineae bacterium]|nr:dihydrolipoamide acetyltransferase family protein [Anaerolineae bacterium]
MAREFKLPDLGEGIHEGEIVKVLVSVGDEVAEDQPILEVETDKATVEIPSPYTGTVSDVRVKAGDLVNVGDVLIVFDGEGAAARPETTTPAPETAEEAEEEVVAERGVPEMEEAPAEGAAPAAPAPRAEKVRAVPPSAEREGPVPASPATRRLARELGVDLQQVPGSGPGGLVTAEDVRAFAEGAPAERPAAEPARPSAAEEAPPGVEEAPPEPARPARAVEVSALRPSAVAVPELPDFTHWGQVERVPLRSVRRSTAKHMALAWSQIPHVSHQDIADVTELEAFRQKHKEAIAERGGSLSLTIFVLKAAIAALKAHPRFNASLDVDAQEIVLKKYYNIGIAVDTEQGLLVPVIRDVDRKSVAELSVELKNLVERTRAREVSIEDMHGGTFTITNPGPLGGTAFAPIVNYPEVAILGMARASWQPVVRGKGANAPIVSRFLLPLIIAFDHRVVDGADAARFLSLVIEILEDPDKLLVMA